MSSFLDSQRSKRIVAAALGPAFWVLGIDAWVAHYAAKSEAHWSQMVPVVVGSIIGLAMLLAAIPDRPRLLSWTLSASGVIASVIGLAGSYYHVVSLIGSMGEEAFTWTSFTEALSVAPPPFAPAAYLGMGGLLVAMGINRVAIRMDLSRGGASTEEALPVPMPSNVAQLEPARKNVASR